MKPQAKRVLSVFSIVSIASLAVASVTVTPVVAAGSCETLASMTLPDTTITLAEAVPAGGFTTPGARGGRGANDGASNLPAFCRVAATIKPSADSDIKIEVWLPSSNWNGKLQAVGNGAFNGAIGYPAMMTALRAGYATTSTDTGHVGGSGDFALGHPEKAIDFGYRVVLVTDALCSSSDATHDALLTVYHQRFAQQVETVEMETVLSNWN